MEDSLRGGVAAPPVSERVWGVPKKRKTTDENPNRGRYTRNSPAVVKREDAVEEMQPDAEPEQEELGYGSNGVRKSRKRQVDVTI
ncbi:MAG: hypothetical protein C4576_06550 [Desulfobacteraceae bacterium]|nr:MAG: hypothetical protein C4576_06550 [Desulfobacteraceae bacterium]